MAVTLNPTTQQSSLLNHNLQKAMAKSAQATAQTSSGKRSENYEGLGLDARRADTLQSQTPPIHQYLRNISDVIVDLDRMSTATQTILERAIDIKNDLMKAKNGTKQGEIPENVKDAVKKTSGAVLSTVLNHLNEKSGSGRYLFGGSVENERPVSTLPDYTISPLTPDTSYYKGYGNPPAIYTGDNEVHSHSITADHEAFESIIRGLSLAQSGDIDNAIGIVSDSIDKLNGVNAEINATKGAVERSKERLGDEEMTLQANLDEIIEADILKSMADASQAFMSLQATMMVQQQSLRALQNFIDRFQIG